ncbi:MAG TPA: SIS domain-containing protein [candidate division WOR-3 bacterium]|uniref:Phosphoheptose isomerase n=1 Tax=candidate division WOR-3 bacterium TaxID=2052148 RepID=A0A7C1BA60_UNCW3|nr:SIS domain-containing protein [candidate division WOR-3 bacterium]
MVEKVREIIKESIATKERLLDISESIARAVEMAAETLKGGHKILLCGNGGSAADSQHIAAEFVVRFTRPRRALPAIALTVDTSVLTAASNDFGYDEVFSRQVEALGEEGDLLIAISTSGRSPNVNRAVRKAKERGLRVIYLCGERGNDVEESVDLTIRVPSGVTARIQVAHITIGHIIVELTEEKLLSG